MAERRAGTKKKTRKKRQTGQRYYDYNLLACVVILTCFGLIMLYSTSAYYAETHTGNDMHFFIRQALIAAVCIVGVLIASQFDYHFYAKLAGVLYGVSNVLLFVTKFVGREINGAKRWLGTESLSFQPSEMAKVAVILYMSNLIYRKGKNLRGIKAPVILSAYGIFTAALALVCTKHLSAAIILSGITVGMLFVAHPKTKKFVIGAGVITVGGYFAGRYLVTEKVAEFFGGFRFARVLVWQDPIKYSDNGGYQVLQGLYAIGSGGLFGKGLGNSVQKLTAIPEAQNDMIFSIICEELGLFGALLLTLLFVFLLYRLMFIAQNAPDLLGAMIATGVFIHIALQVVMNIAVVLNVIPTTGITLPFVSYGGTSILFLMSEMALVLSVSGQIRIKEETAEV